MSPLAAEEMLRLIIGCGYLGRRVAARWLAAGYRVAALTRRHADVLSALGIEPIIGDVLQPDTLKSLPAAPTVLYAVGFDRTLHVPMRDIYVRGLANVLDVLPPGGRVLYISSTSVYGQCNGEWVTEDSPTEPTEDAGTVVLEAERLLRARRPDAIILRFAGIYGPGRLLRKTALLKGEPLAADPERLLNLIHVDDGADAVLRAESHAAPGETYNIADDEPVTRRAFYTLLAALLHGPPAAFDARPEPGMQNRRISNAKAKLRLGWMPRYAHYRAGLTAAVAESVC